MGVGKVGNMPVTKIDDKGRIVLPKEIRQRLQIHSGDEFLVNEINSDIVVLKRFDVEKTLKMAIKQAKGIDLNNLERMIEEEGNRVAQKIISGSN